MGVKRQYHGAPKATDGNDGGAGISGQDDSGRGTHSDENANMWSGRNR